MKETIHTERRRYPPGVLYGKTPAAGVRDSPARSRNGDTKARAPRTQVYFLLAVLGHAVWGKGWRGPKNECLNNLTKDDATLSRRRNNRRRSVRPKDAISRQERLRCSAVVVVPSDNAFASGVTFISPWWPLQGRGHLFPRDELHVARLLPNS